MKPRVSVYDQELLTAITERKDAIREAYHAMRENGLMLTSEVLTREVERTLIAKGNSTKKSQPIQVRRMADVFSEWIDGQYESGVLEWEGEGIMKFCRGNLAVSSR